MKFNLRELFDFRNPLDRIIELTDKKYVSIWNGVSNNREFMFRLNGRTGDKYNPNTQWIGLSFGRWYNSYPDGQGESVPILAIYIDHNRKVVYTEMCPPYDYNSNHKELFEECKRLALKIKHGRKLKTKYSVILNRWFNEMFGVNPVVRYYKRIFMEDILNPDNEAKAVAIWNTMKDQKNRFMVKTAKQVAKAVNNFADKLDKLK